MTLPHPVRSSPLAKWPGLGGLRLDWPRAALQDALHTAWPGMVLELRPSVGSTNTELLEGARQGDLAPRLLVAEHQGAGRGRLGRLWQSAQAHQPQGSLTFSVRVPLAPADWSGLSLAVGVALAQALGEQVLLKWPNDLWLMEADGRGRKLAGILVETVSGAAAMAVPGAARQVVVGVGINVRPTQDEPALPAGGAPQGAAPVGRAHVSEWWPAATPPGVLQAVAVPLLQALRRFEQDGLASFLAAYAQRDLLAGRRVNLHPAGADGPPTASGVARGVDAQGCLLVDTAQGSQRIHSGEVSVRPC